MRVTIFGAGGMLGQAAAGAFTAAGHEVTALDRVACDVTDDAAVDRVCAAVRPEAIVNCAAFTKVDDCEREVARAFAVNGEAVGNLALAAGEHDALLLQVSSDFVFDGSKGAPYTEADAPSPLSVYGASKLEGERQATRAPRFTVVRASWLFGPGGWNFVEAIRKQVDEGKTALSVVDDQVGCPTYTPYFARALVALAAAEHVGIVHYANPPAVSWHGFAAAIVEELGREDVTIEPIRSATLARPARRPAYSVLDAALYTRLTAEPPLSWRDGLAEYAGGAGE